MRLFLRLLVLLAIAIGLAVAARFNVGNVVLFYPPYRIDLSLNLFLLLIALLFLSLYFLIRTIRMAQRMPGRVAAYRQARRERDGNQALRDALKALFEGRFGHAEKAAKLAADLPENAGLAALIGARAAHWMRQPERRDAWLSNTQNDLSLKTARLMTAIELLVDDHQSEAALEAVRELNASSTRHIHALRLALKANQQAKNWPEVLRLVQSLDKNKALHPALSRRLRELAYDDELSNSSQDAESIRRVWKSIPTEDQQEPFIAARAAAAFNVRGLHDDARRVVEKALSADWDARLVRAYRESAAAEGEPALLAQIEYCEGWIKKRPTDAELALTLGSLCLKQKLWGKAQRYLEQALSDAIEPASVRDAHLKLAQLHDALNQAEQAAIHYRLCALASIL
ncbi:heme biosynthesis protein HemY [Herminiimonas sp. CN]|uniref:heme biosynthesis protein HemY n=1 Tax=Herminiimonas sp. CN TaxID=1349818 RepID=UPI00047438FB|nr:heme biosynthesis protein HemY [Herminiimonas sp. CN]